MSFIQGSLLCPLFRGLYCILYSGVSIVSFIQGSLFCPLFRGLYCVLYSGVSIVSFIQGSLLCPLFRGRLLCPLFRGLYCVLYFWVFLYGRFHYSVSSRLSPWPLLGTSNTAPERLMTLLSPLPFKVTGLDWQSTHTL